MPPRVWALLGVLPGAVVVPLVTLHALVLHFTGMGHTGLDRWLGDPGLLGVAALIMLSSLSTAAVLVAALQWRAQAIRLSRFTGKQANRLISGLPVVVVPGDVVLRISLSGRKQLSRGLGHWPDCREESGS